MEFDNIPKNVRHTHQNDMFTLSRGKLTAEQIVSVRRMQIKLAAECSRSCYSSALEIYLHILTAVRVFLTASFHPHTVRLAIAKHACTYTNTHTYNLSAITCNSSDVRTHANATTGWMVMDAFLMQQTAAAKNKILCGMKSENGQNERPFSWAVIVVPLLLASGCC